MRTLCLCAAIYNFDIYSEHVSGSKNTIADSLSCLQMERFRHADHQAEKTPTACPQISEVMWNLGKWLKN